MTDPLRRDFWQPTEIEPNVFLESLRECVMDGPEPARHSPKWRFRLAPDLAIEIQPKDSSRLLFQGLALLGDGITVETFKEPKKSRRGLTSEMSFHILKTEDQRWALKPQGRVYRTAGSLKERVIDCLENLTFKDRAVLLSFHCLICGKGLTDPVSRARLIGPECAGRASIVVPLHLIPVDTPSSENGIVRNDKKQADDLDEMIGCALELIYEDLELFEKAYQEFRAGEQTQEAFMKTLTEFSDSYAYEISEYLDKSKALDDGLEDAAVSLTDPVPVNIEEKSEPHAMPSSKEKSKSPTRAIPCQETLF